MSSRLHAFLLTGNHVAAGRSGVCAVCGWDVQQQRDVRRRRFGDGEGVQSVRRRNPQLRRQLKVQPVYGQHGRRPDEDGRLQGVS